MTRTYKRERPGCRLSAETLETVLLRASHTRRTIHHREYPTAGYATTSSGPPLNGRGEKGGESRARVTVTGGRDKIKGHCEARNLRRAPTADKHLCTARANTQEESGGHGLSVGEPGTLDATDIPPPTPLSGKDEL